MKLRITIDLDNAAFDSDVESELRRILDNVAHKITREVGSFVILGDSNGNTVGQAQVTS